GLVDLSSNSSSGIRYFDGSVSTTAALPGDATKVTKTGDVMSGPLTVWQSSITIVQGGLIASSATINGPLTASSGTFTGSGTGLFVANGMSVSVASFTRAANFYSIYTSSGINLIAGLVD